MVRSGVLLLALMAAAIQGLETDRQEAFLSTNPAEKVPVVGAAFQVNAVSTAMQCVISLTIQFFVIYTALALCRSFGDAMGMKYNDKNFPIQKILQTAVNTVTFAPMLSILFLAFRMRVTQLTKGKGNPPEWCQMCMYFCTYSVLLMTLIVCVIPLFTGEVIQVDEKTGEIPKELSKDKDNVMNNWICATFFTVLKYLILLGLYGGVLALIYGISTYEPPAGIWPAGKDFPVAPAVQCTMILSCQFFFVYGGMQVARTWSQFTGMVTTNIENALNIATASINFAPMLAVLFIGARMRALQMDPVNGNPQKWAQNCFFMCTYALAVQTSLAVAVPLVLGGTAKKGDKGEGDMEITHTNTTIAAVLSLGRYVIMICIYIGFSCVIWSIFTIEHPQGPQYTPPISVTMQCVINLTVQFFFIYLWIWVAISINEFTGFSWKLMSDTMENAKATVMYCPMLAILFVGTRMRALMLTNNKGAPQGWAQDGMYMATWSLLIQFVMILATSLATGAATECDEDGNSTWKPSDGNKIALYACITIKWLGYILLYGGVIAVVVGVYTMTPETANGRGAVPLVGDGKVPGVGVGVPGYEGIKEPYGANDLPLVPRF